MTTSPPAAAAPAPPRLFAAVALAAGRSRRIRSERSKLLLPLAGRPAAGWAAEALLSLAPQEAAAVVAPGEAGAAVAEAFPPPFRPAVQEQPLGTGDAALTGLRALSKGSADDEVLIATGDSPCLRSETLAHLCTARRRVNAASAWLAFTPEGPHDYGLFELAERDPSGGGRAIRITEARDRAASDADNNSTATTAAPDLVWSGVLVATRAHLERHLPSLKSDNAQGECLLTDLAALAHAAGETALVVPCPASEGAGINTRADLAAAEAVIQARLRAAALAGGAGLVAPETVFLSHDTELEQDCRIEPWVWLGPHVRIGAGAVVRSFSHLEGAELAPGAQVGPFARLRPGTALGEEARIGSFVEAKAARLGAGAKAPHLSYLGDAEIGPGSNIGAGTITCNYDGFNKHRTTLGPRVFIGANVSLVAPLKIGEGAVVGAGSTVAKDAPADALVIARPEQKTLPGGASRRVARLSASAPSSASAPASGRGKSKSGA